MAARKTPHGSHARAPWQRCCSTVLHCSTPPSWSTSRGSCAGPDGKVLIRSGPHSLWARSGAGMVRSRVCRCGRHVVSSALPGPPPAAQVFQSSVPSHPSAATLGYAGSPNLAVWALASRGPAALGRRRRRSRALQLRLRSCSRAVDARVSSPQVRIASGSSAGVDSAGSSAGPYSPDLPASSRGRPSVKQR